MKKGLKKKKINDLSFYLKKLEKEEQINLKESRKKEISRKQWEKKEYGKIKGKINKTKVSLGAGRIVKINKSLARLIKKKKKSPK